MKKIKEAIVVEGKNDAHHLESFFDCLTIITNGTHLSQQTLDLIEKINQERGIIVFCDDDSPGRMIRDKIQARLKNCLHAFISPDKSRKGKKVGVEHAKYEDLLSSLEKVCRFVDDNQSLLWHDFLSLNLMLNKNLQKKVREYYALPSMNTKRLFKTLNLLNVSKNDLIEVLNYD